MGIRDQVMLEAVATAYISFRERGLVDDEARVAVADAAGEQYTTSQVCRGCEMGERTFEQFAARQTGFPHTQG